MILFYIDQMSQIIKRFCTDSFNRFQFLNVRKITDFCAISNDTCGNCWLIRGKVSSSARVAVLILTLPIAFLLRDVLLDFGCCCGSNGCAYGVFVESAKSESPVSIVDCDICCFCIRNSVSNALKSYGSVG